MKSFQRKIDNIASKFFEWESKLGHGGVVLKFQWLRFLEGFVFFLAAKDCVTKTTAAFLLRHFWNTFVLVFVLICSSILLPEV